MPCGCVVCGLADHHLPPQREKHLKCDGQTPCSRCVSSSFHCFYVASRRGYKGPRRGTAQNPNKRQATSPPEAGADCPMLLGAGTSQSRMSASMASGVPATYPSTPYASTPFPPTPGSGNAIAGTQPYRAYCAANGIDASSLILANPNLPVSAQIPIQTLEEQCLDSFYKNFHASHPFVLPKQYLLQIAKEGTIEPLLAAIRWVGSLYIDIESSKASLLDEAYRLIYDPEHTKDGFVAQALMILIVGLDGNCQQDKARELLGEVERIALQIDLNTRPFATLNGRGMPVLEESWRRTWWDLFVIDGMVAGVHRVTNFLLFDVPADVALPCEEHQFLSGVSAQDALSTRIR